MSEKKTKFTKKQEEAIRNAAMEVAVFLEDELRAKLQELFGDPDVADEIHVALSGVEGGIDDDTPEKLQEELIDAVIEMWEDEVMEVGVKQG